MKPDCTPFFLLLFFCTCICSADVLYETDFDAMTVTATEFYPGYPDHDGWFLLNAPPYGYGRIQDAVANPGKALHEHADSSDSTGAQTIDRRNVTVADLSPYPIITLEADFYASTSDLQARNSFFSAMEVIGGPHPGYYILGFSIFSGNGELKENSRLNINMPYFNGVNNNDGLPLTVGQGLAWDSWHHITVVIDQGNDRYVSLTVDGQAQTLEEFALPRSDDAGVWKRGQMIESIQTMIVPDDNFGDETDDDIYWDNISLTGSCPLQADLTGDCDVDLEDLAIMAAEWLT